MFSVLLSPINKEYSEAKETKLSSSNINFEKRINNILKKLYLSRASKRSYVDYLYSWLDGAEDLIAKQKQAAFDAQKEINILLNELRDVITLTEEQSNTLADKIYEAHSNLLHACISENIEEIKSSLAQIENLPLPQQAKLALLQSNLIPENNAYPDYKTISTYGLFGFVARKFHPTMLKLFLETGISLYACDLVTKEPCLFKIVTSPEYITIVPSYSAKVIPYNNMKELIHLYLDLGFDINFCYKDRNILEYIFSNCKIEVYPENMLDIINDKNYALELMIDKIVAFVQTEKVSRKSFCEFCNKMGETIKEFPLLLNEFNKRGGNVNYKDESEQWYFEIKAFCRKLLHFCNYINARINKNTNYFATDDKNKSLEKCIIGIYNVFTHTNVDINESMINILRTRLQAEIEKLDQIFHMARGYSFPFYANEPLSVTEWKIFLNDNPDVNLFLTQKAEVGPLAKAVFS